MARAVSSTATSSHRETTPTATRRRHVLRTGPRSREAELGVAVEEQAHKVAGDEDEGQSGEPAVHREQRRVAAPLREEIGREDDAPEHRRGQHEPRYDACGSERYQRCAGSSCAPFVGAGTFKTRGHARDPLQGRHDPVELVAVQVVQRPPGAAEEGGGGVHFSFPSGPRDDGRAARSVWAHVPVMGSMT